jgi:subtilisin-like proprotein convertase family protein
MQKPSLGRVVIALVNPNENNGSDVAPAEITRVWSEREDGTWTINVKVNLDGPGHIWKTSIHLLDTEEQARAAYGNSPAHVAFWPARV